MLIRKVCLVIYLAFTLFGCGKDPVGEDASRLPFRFLVLAPGSYLDDSTNQRCYEALQRISARLKLNIRFEENVAPGDVAGLVSEHSGRKHDFVIALGAQLLPPIIKSAKKEPLQKTAVIGKYSGNSSNLGALSYQPSHYYLAGVVAGLKSKNRKIGAISGDSNPQIDEDTEAFFAGVHRVNPTIHCTNLLLGNWDDQRKAVQYANTLKDNQVDVIFVNCGKAGAGIYPWATKNQIMTIGSIDDQFAQAPNSVLTSVRTDYEKMLSYAIELMLKGQWQGTLYRFGMAEKVTDIAPLRGVLTPQQEDTFYEIYRELAARKGEISKEQ